jgi:hypothetical protein
MENNILVKQMMDYQKAAFESTFNSVAMVQDQTEKLFRDFVQKSAFIPPQSKEVFNDWVNIYRKGRLEFKEAAEDNYKKVGDYFAKGLATPKPKDKKR